MAPTRPHPFPVIPAVAFLVIAWFASAIPMRAGPAEAPPDAGFQASILVYHRFGASVTDGMTVRTATFRRQIEYLRDHDYPVVTLGAVVAYLRGTGPRPPARAVVITADDGHRSVFTEMWPVVRDHPVPVTLFIYPSAISNASYAMTWDQLRTLRDSGLFDIESHTFWHPNFAIEQHRLAPDAYQDFARMQFCKAASVLRARTGAAPTVVAWPFGIADQALFPVVRDCGYVAAVTLQRRTVTSRDDVMVLPRFLVTDMDTDSRFAAMLPLERAR